MSEPPFTEPLCEEIWASRYRFVAGESAVDRSPADTFARVARAAAAVEPDHAAQWAARFARLLSDLAFLPGGRILAGAGTGRAVTLANCFVMGPLPDDLPGIFAALRDGAVTLQAGGGIGCDFSTLPPAAVADPDSGVHQAGPVRFMHVWDSMCATISATGYRRGAMMATLRIDHPDILEFIRAKADLAALQYFNCSVLVSEAFMAALAADADWPLQFRGYVHRIVSARAIWQALLENAHAASEPGVLFIDQINRENNLAYRESLTTTNPCGEVPLPAWGACLLGSSNLTAYVRDPFTSAARFDHAALGSDVGSAVRMLDNLLEVSSYPLPAQRAESQMTRRIGIGFMGLGSALNLLGMHYDSDAARAQAAAIARTLRDSAYRASIGLASERGPFPAYDRDRYAASPFVKRLPTELQDALARDGIRNSHLLAIAPTGTISLLANNVSSGIEPVFRATFSRTLRAGAEARQVLVEDFAARRWREQFGKSTPLPAGFATAAQLEPRAHLEMQAAVQPLIDQGISKTIQVSPDLPLAAFGQIYQDAYRLGLKGVTTFRPRLDRQAVLE